VEKPDAADDEGHLDEAGVRGVGGGVFSRVERDVSRAEVVVLADEILNAGAGA
jgi:hypothetical protein